MVEADSQKRKREETSVYEIIFEEQNAAAAKCELKPACQIRRQKKSKEEYRNVSTVGKCPFIL